MYTVLELRKGDSSEEYTLEEASVPDEARRIRKRNRVLQSCISCHQLRRKCDRARPCARCTEHGNGGGCVYQLEDPAIRQGPEQDELTRLRARVTDLERTVRVLMQRPLSKAATESLGLEVDESTLLLRKINRESGDSDEQGREKSRKVSGRVKSEDTSNRQSPGVLPSETLEVPSHAMQVTHTVPFDFSSQGTHGMSHLSLGGAPAHCGCAYNQTGREYYVYLLSRVGDTIQKLKGLPEHQQGVSCFVLHRLSEVYDAISSTVHSSAPTPYGYPTSTAMGAAYATQSYSTAFSPTSSSPPHQQPSISLSHPSSYHHQHSTPPSMGQAHAYQQQSIQQPTYPYPYTASASHSSSPSGTMGSSQHMSRQSQANVPTMAHRSSGVPSSSQQYSSLTQWDSIGQHSASSRHASRHGVTKGGLYDPASTSR